MTSSSSMETLKNPKIYYRSNSMPTSPTMDKTDISLGSQSAPPSPQSETHICENHENGCKDVFLCKMVTKIRMVAKESAANVAASIRVSNV